MRKKRILLCNESSLLSTGFSVYGMELLTRLANTGKYELAELASYGHPYDSRREFLPWKYYGNLPIKDSDVADFNSRVTHQFGEWKFDDVCIDFKPDIVFDIRDWWMTEFEQRSPARQYFHWVLMPTVDSEPQDESWISTFQNADGIFCYSDYGVDLIKRQCGDKIKVLGSAPPGANLSAYKIATDKKAVKKEAGLPTDYYIVGTIMRNQPRKLYPDLFDAFSLFLKKAPEYLAQKTCLYVHCAYPDLGWDIPRLLKETGISHKVFFTYMCRNCNSVYPSFFQDTNKICKICGQHTAFLPGVKDGVPTSVLGKILQTFDVYVQYASCEGFGMPQVEAAACGIPVMAVDYSAMSDIVRKVKGIPIKVERMFRESQGHLLRAYPDNNDLAEKLINFFSKPVGIRAKMGLDARKAVETYYTWERTAKIWENYFDSVEIKDLWDRPANHHTPQNITPEIAELSNTEFVRWALTNIAGRPDLMNSHVSSRVSRDLNAGKCLNGMPSVGHSEFADDKQESVEFNRDILVNHLYNVCNYRNDFEYRRIRNVTRRLP